MPTKSKFPKTAEIDKDRKLKAALCYIPLFFLNLLVPLYLLLSKDYREDRFLRFHAIQSICYTLAIWLLGMVAVVAVILLVVIGWVATFGAILASAGLAAFAAFPIVFIAVMAFYALAILTWLAVFLSWFYLAYRAYQGDEYHLPRLGDFATKHV